MKLHTDHVVAANGGGHGLPVFSGRNNVLVAHRLEVEAVNEINKRCRLKAGEDRVLIANKL